MYLKCMAAHKKEADSLFPGEFRLYKNPQPLQQLLRLFGQEVSLSDFFFSFYIQGDVILPSKTKMEADIMGKEKAMSLRYVHSKRHTIQVDYLPFMDELATLNGNKPNIGRCT